MKEPATTNTTEEASNEMGHGSNSDNNQGDICIDGYRGDRARMAFHNESESFFGAIRLDSADHEMTGIEKWSFTFLHIGFMALIIMTSLLLPVGMAVYHIVGFSKSIVGRVRKLLRGNSI